MQKLLIKGKKELNGKINISGSKNATLPILAATILADKVTLKNIPLVKDIFTMIELLKFIGLNINISKNKNKIEVINNKRNIKTLAPYKLMKTMRAGVLVLGPLLAKNKKAKIYANEGVAQLVFIRGNEKPSITYAKRKGKYMKQKGVTLPKI
mgnify:CR=1 FL=1